MPEIILQDDENLRNEKECSHSFSWQASLPIEGIIYDVFFCQRCLTHVKKERPCPLELEEKN